MIGLGLGLDMKAKLLLSAVERVEICVDAVTVVIECPPFCPMVVYMVVVYVTRVV